LGKALFSISINVLIILTFLAIWESVDPYRSTLEVVDEIRLLGKYTCSSKYLTIWVSLIATFLALNLMWGIFVIYETWSFQKLSVIGETRWVLIALYDVFLNAAVLIPFLISSKPDDDIVSLAFVISIDFSATGIIFAVLGPSTLREIWGSTQHPSSGRSKTTGIASKKNNDDRDLESKDHYSPDHQAVSPSASDEIQSLVNPQPLHFVDQLSVSRSANTNNNKLEFSSSQPEVQLESLPHPIPEEPLEWSANPVSTSS